MSDSSLVCDYLNRVCLFRRRLALMIAIPLYLTMSSFAQSSEPSTLLVEDVRCQGNVVTPCPTLRTYLHLSAGDELDEQEVQDGKLRLSSLPNLVSVDVFLAKGSLKGRVVVVIEVVESDRVENEISSGMSSRLAGVSQSVDSRLAQRNVLGSHDTINLDVKGLVPIQGQNRRGIYTRMQVLDPTLLDSSRYFVIGGATYQNTLLAYSGNAFDKTKQLDIDFSLGRRLFDYSYLTAGYVYRPISESVSQYLKRPGFLATDTDPNNNKGLAVSYGWDSEDDSHFPAEGSRLSATFGTSWASVRFRKTWSTVNSAWTVQIGGSPGTQYRASLTESQNVSVAYQHSLSVSEQAGEITRGRWYAEPGFSYDGTLSVGKRVGEWGLKVGVRLDTKVFGVIDLYAFATTTEHFP